MLFDDPGEHRAAWCCLQGGRPYRIRGIEDISNDAVFMTNMSFEDMYSAGFANHAFLRRSTFLRLRHDAILKEVGLESAPPDQQVQGLASIFGNVVQIMQKALSYPKVPLGEMRSTVREVLLPPDPRLSDDMINAIRDATQEYVTTERNRRSGTSTRTIGLWFPRVDHARNILQTRVPASEKYDILRPPPCKDPEETQAWIIEQMRPMLLRVRLRDVLDETIYPLINYGAGVMPRRDRAKGRMVRTWTPSRQWITSIEAMYMLPYLNFEIIEVRAFTESQKLIDHPVIQGFFEHITPAHRVSYSVGLFAENLWMGAAAELSRVAQSAESANLMTPFLRAQDRGLCFAAARILHEWGLDVIGYGAGRIHIAGYDEPHALIRACSEAGLVPEPMPKVDKLKFTGEDQDILTLQTIAMHGSWDSIHHIDDFVLGGAS